MSIKATPAAQWREAGEPDPHGDIYNCERAALTLGTLTDDELANGAFMNYDVRLPLQDMLNPKPGQHMPIVWMTAVKERIRWLSRSLESALAIPSPQPATTKEAEGEALQLRSWIDTAIEAITDGGTGSKATALSALRKAQAASPQPAEAVQAEPTQSEYDRVYGIVRYWSNRANYLEDQLAAKTAEAKTAAVERIRHAGAMLSNCAFNMAQRKPGEPLTDSDIRALDESRKAWDAAIATQEGGHD